MGEAPVVHAKTETAQIHAAIKQQKGDQSIFRPAQNRMYQVSGEEHGTGVVAEGKKIVRLIAGDFSGTIQFAGKLGAHGITAEHTQDPGIGAIGGKPQNRPPDRGQGFQKDPDHTGAKKEA